MGDRDDAVEGTVEAAANGPVGGEATSPEPAAGTEAAAAAGTEAAAAAAPETLAARVTALEAGLRERNEDLLRERAEVENFKRRMLREKTDSLRFALEPLLRDLFPIVDNLERALQHADAAAVVDGVQLVLKSLHGTLARHGVERVEADGHRFDPNVHEAIAQVESPDHAAGAVVQQHQVGYRLHERLLRPAMVTVNARKAAVPVESGKDSD